MPALPIPNKSCHNCKHASFLHSIEYKGVIDDKFIQDEWGNWYITCKNPRCFWHDMDRKSFEGSMCPDFEKKQGAGKWGGPPEITI